MIENKMYFLIWLLLMFITKYYSSNCDLFFKVQLVDITLPAKLQPTI